MSTARKLICYMVLSVSKGCQTQLSQHTTEIRLNSQVKLIANASNRLRIIMPVATVMQNSLHPLSNSSIIARHPLDFMVQRKITEKTHQRSVWMPPHADYRCPHIRHPPIFMPNALSVANLPIYPGFGQAPNNAGR